MATISTSQKTPRTTRTVADLDRRRFGPIPFGCIRQEPPPGSGTVADVVRLNDHVSGYEPHFFDPRLDRLSWSAVDAGLAVLADFDIDGIGAP